MMKKAPATVSKELKELSRKKILRERKERRFNFYKADIGSEAYRDLKTYYNIRKIRNSGLIEELNKIYLKPTVILFGSACQGTDTDTSDFDLVVISEKTPKFQAKEFEKKLNHEIQMFNIKSIKDLKNKHLINNVLNGIVLQGELKWT